MTTTTITETAEYYELILENDIRTFVENDWDDASQMARITGADFFVVTVNAETGVEISRREVVWAGGW